jgi:hypothetical protein
LRWNRKDEDLMFTPYDEYDEDEYEYFDPSEEEYPR